MTVNCGIVTGARQADLQRFSNSTTSKIYRESSKKVKISNEWQFYGLKSNSSYHKQPSNHPVNVIVFHLALNR